MRLLVQNPGDDVEAIADAIARICGTQDCESKRASNRAFFACGPVDDLADFISKIDFGIVTEVDTTRRTIRVIGIPEGLRQ